MDNPFAALGVEPIVNASGTATRLSGGPMRAEVAAAMAAAAQACVDIAALQDAAGARLAGLAGAEAGMVTAGAAAGLMLGAAACIAGLEPAAMGALPYAGGRANEILMARSQRNFYDHAVRQAGARIVDVGLPDRYSGAGSAMRRRGSSPPRSGRAPRPFSGWRMPTPSLGWRSWRGWRRKRGCLCWWTRRPRCRR